MITVVVAMLATPAAPSSLAGFFADCEAKHAYLQCGPNTFDRSTKYLGLISRKSYESNSLANSYGLYGSTSSTSSIWCNYGPYGRREGARSPWNSNSINPPEIVYSSMGRTFIKGYLTVNPSFMGEYQVPIIDPSDLKDWLGR